MLKKIIKEYYIANKTDCITVLIFICCGILAGIISMVFIKDDQFQMLIQKIADTFSKLNEIGTSSIYVIYNGLKNNFYLVLIMILVTITILGKQGIYVISFIKGVSIGIYTVILLNVLGLWYGMLAILLLVVIINIIYIPAYVYLAVTLIVFNFELFKTRRDSMNAYIIMSLCLKILVGCGVMCSSMAMEQMLTPVIIQMFQKVNI